MRCQKKAVTLQHQPINVTDMKFLFKTFICLFLLVFVLPMLWFVLKELLWLFGISVEGIFAALVSICSGLFWILIVVLIAAAVVWILSNL